MQAHRGDRALYVFCVDALYRHLFTLLTVLNFIGSSQLFISKLMSASLVTHAVLRPLFQDNQGQPVLSQRRDLLEQPLDFYEPDVLPATQPVMSKH